MMGSVIFLIFGSSLNRVTSVVELKQKTRKSIRFMSSLFFEHAVSKPKHKVTIKTTRSTSCGFSVFLDCFDQSQVPLLQFL